MADPPPKGDWQQALWDLPDDLLSPDEKRDAHFAILRLHATPEERLRFLSGDRTQTARWLRERLPGAQERSCDVARAREGLLSWAQMMHCCWCWTRVQPTALSKVGWAMGPEQHAVGVVGVLMFSETLRPLFCMRSLLCGAQAPLCIGLASLSFASSHYCHFTVLLGLGQPTARPGGAAGVAGATGATGEPSHSHLMRVQSTRQKESVRVSAHPPCPSLPQLLMLSMPPFEP